MKAKHRSTLALVAIAFAFLAIAAASAQAKEVVDYFGTDPSIGFGSKGGEFNGPGQIATEFATSGPYAGDLYAVDANNNRIQRFHRNTHGTATPNDDTYEFVSAWGTDVVSSGGAGNVGDAAAKDYEVCTVASQCKAGVPASGNGSAAGNGDLGARPAGVAVDSDTGDVYVSDAANNRVNVYDGAGAFLRSFGYEVVASGLDNVAGANERQTLTVNADGGKFALDFGGQTTGARGRGKVTGGLNTVTNVTTTSGAFAVGQTFSDSKNLFPPAATITAVSGNTLTISQASSPSFGANADLFADDLPFDATAAQLQSALNALPTIGGAGGSVSVSGAAGGPYTVDFAGSFAGTDLPSLAPDVHGLTQGAGAGSVDVAETVKGGAYEVCEAGADVCGAGASGSGTGEIGAGRHIAVSTPDSNAATGTVFLADSGSERIDSFALDGSSPSSLGSPALFDCGGGCSRPNTVAVDSRGIVYADNFKNGNQIERYDTTNADDTGVGFLAPIAAGANEVQQVKVIATAGTFKLTYDGETTPDLPFDASSSQVQDALTALPALGPSNVPNYARSVGVDGGPGDPTGSHPYTFTFRRGLAARDVDQLVAADGATPLSGGGGVSTQGGGRNSNGDPVPTVLKVAAAAGQFRLTAPVAQDFATWSTGSDTISLQSDSTAYGAFRAGEEISGAGIPAGTTIVSCSPSCGPGATGLTLSQALSSAGYGTPVSDLETTADLPFDAPASGAGSVEAALAALPGIGAGNVAVSGGPGDPSDSNPYTISFTGVFAGKSVDRVNAFQGSTPLTGALSGASAATTVPGSPGLLPSTAASAVTHGLAVDPADDTLYALREGIVQQFGPTNPAGLTAPPGDDDARHGTTGGFSSPSGLGLDPADGRLYVSASGLSGYGAQSARGVYILDDPAPVPTASFDSISDITCTSATVNGSVNPNGPPQVSAHLEYSPDGTSWTALPEVTIGTQNTPQPLNAALDPPAGGLAPNTTYHVRIVVTKQFTAPIVPSEQTFDTLACPPDAETTGAQVRTSTTATLSGRVNPRNAATTYHFDYGTTASYGQSSADQSAGSDDLIHIVNQKISGLAPNTTYHYRLVADNGAPGSPAQGADRTFTTRATDAPLSHGDFPGPPGSDRAWELLSAPDTSGNPADVLFNLAPAGDRATYQIFGGTPISESGAAQTQLYTQRPAGQHPSTGWQSKWILPSRQQIDYSAWGFIANPDLSDFLAATFNAIDYGDVWHTPPDGVPTPLFSATGDQFGSGEDFLAASDDLSRVTALYAGKSFDPAHPLTGAALGASQLYEIGSGAPHLIGLLPGEGVASCGIPPNTLGPPDQSRGWLSADGRYAFFPSQGNSCSGPTALYVRDLVAGETKLASGPALGSDCGASFIRSSADAAFFWTQSRLVSEDTAPGSCDGSVNGDVYRYDLASGALTCVTCAAPGLDADVYWATSSGGVTHFVAVSADGSRVYFRSQHKLLAGAAADGIYRVNVASGELAYVGPSDGSNVGFEDPGAEVSADGTVFAFRSDDPGLDPLGAGAPTNAGTAQYYLYDDNDRSLTCVSCPPDGSAPRAEAPESILNQHLFGTSLSADGDTFAFTTPSPLLAADGNTAPGAQDPREGTDAYEWRDGRPQLLSDGLTTWPIGTADAETPKVDNVTPSGHDVVFNAAARYTQDALDSIRRIYDARIGGGMDFPPPELPPCDLNSGACRGAPSSAPDQPGAGSGAFAGPRNPPVTWPKRRCPKSKRKVRRKGKVRCVAKHKHHKHKRKKHHTHNTHKHHKKRHHKRAHAERRTHR